MQVAREDITFKSYFCNHKFTINRTNCISDAVKARYSLFIVKGLSYIGYSLFYVKDKASLALGKNTKASNY